MPVPVPVPDKRIDEVMLALTFDDGPGPSTNDLLDALAAVGAKATFFFLGCNIERWPACAVRAAREGHVLGNHTYGHARPETIGREPFLKEIVRTDTLLERIAREASVPLRNPIPVRLPYGPSAGDLRLDWLQSVERSHVHWSAHFEDWLDPPPSVLVARMRSHIAEQHAHGRRAILDLHDASRHGATRHSTVEAVRILLEDPSLRLVTVLP